MTYFKLDHNYIYIIHLFVLLSYVSIRSSDILLKYFFHTIICYFIIIITYNMFYFYKYLIYIVYIYYVSEKYTYKLLNLTILYLKQDLKSCIFLKNYIKFVISSGSPPINFMDSLYD